MTTPARSAEGNIKDFPNDGLRSRWEQQLQDARNQLNQVGTGSTAGSGTSTTTPTVDPLLEVFRADTQGKIDKYERKLREAKEAGDENLVRRYEQRLRNYRLRLSNLNSTFGPTVARADAGNSGVPPVR